MADMSQWVNGDQQEFRSGPSCFRLKTARDLRLLWIMNPIRNCGCNLSAAIYGQKQNNRSIQWRSRFYILHCLAASLPARVMIPPKSISMASAMRSNVSSVGFRKSRSMRLTIECERPERCATTFIERPRFSRSSRRSRTTLTVIASRTLLFDTHKP